MFHCYRALRLDLVFPVSGTAKNGLCSCPGADKIFLARVNTLSLGLLGKGDDQRGDIHRRGMGYLTGCLGSVGDRRFVLVPLTMQEHWRYQTHYSYPLRWNMVRTFCKDMETRIPTEGMRIASDWKLVTRRLKAGHKNGQVPCGWEGRQGGFGTSAPTRNGQWMQPR